MNVLLINGSPHKEGCTYHALCEVAKTLNAAGIETTIYHIGPAPVGGCVGCGGCAKAGHCVFGGPVVDVLPLVEKADGIVFDDEGTLREMFNPEIVYRKGLYLTEEGCLSLQGQRKTKRHKTMQMALPLTWVRMTLR